MAHKVLITGAASGIGYDTVKRFAAEGWDVVAAVRSDARAGELADALRSDGVEAQIVVFDLADRETTDTALAAIIAEGVPDVLVNNASIGTVGPAELTSDAQIDLSLETNFVAPFRIARALVPHFRERGTGVIVNVSSGVGFAADVGQGIYAATKHAIEGLSEAMSLELQPFGVRVVVIEPGSTQTDFVGKSAVTDGYGPDSPYWSVLNTRYERLASTIWKNGIGSSSEVADAIFDAAINADTPLFVPVGDDTKLSAHLRGRDEIATYGDRLNQALDAMA